MRDGEFAMTATVETEEVALKAGLRVMLSEEQLLRIVPLSKVSIWRLEKRGTFPKSTFISANRRIWWADEIVAWQAEVNGRARGRRQQPTRRTPEKV
jgi:prophage regulatory protein